MSEEWKKRKKRGTKSKRGRGRGGGQEGGTYRQLAHVGQYTTRFSGRFLHLGNSIIEEFVEELFGFHLDFVHQERDKGRHSAL